MIDQGKHFVRAAGLTSKLTKVFQTRAAVPGPEKKSPEQLKTLKQIRQLLSERPARRRAVTPKLHLKRRRFSMPQSV